MSHPSTRTRTVTQMIVLRDMQALEAAMSQVVALLFKHSPT